MVQLLQNKYKFDYVTLREYGDLVKVTYHKSPVLVSGFEDGRSPGRHPNTDKLDNSLSRTKSTIKELALCNPWEYFITLTLDKTKYDRYNLDKYRADLAQYIRNYNRLNSATVRYLLIPEQHKDGAWHMHGLVMGLPSTALTNNANGYLDWLGYSKRFGYCSLDRIKSKTKVSSYITKYVSKDIGQRSSDLHAHLYYASKGLQRSTLLYEGRLSNSIDLDGSWDFSNEYVSISWCDRDQLKRYRLD